jgi:hypothetical protein
VGPGEQRLRYAAVTTAMSTGHVRPGVRDAVISILAISALIVLLAAIDERVRDQGVRLMSRGTSSSVAQASAEVSSTSAGLIATLRDQALEHGAMTAFVIVAGVLVVFMLRT